jgi:hypothetical protein
MNNEGDLNVPEFDLMNTYVWVQYTIRKLTSCAVVVVDFNYVEREIKSRLSKVTAVIF